MDLLWDVDLLFMMKQMKDKQRYDARIARLRIPDPFTGRCFTTLEDIEIYGMRYQRELAQSRARGGAAVSPEPEERPVQAPAPLRDSVPAPTPVKKSFKRRLLCLVCGCLLALTCFLSWQVHDLSIQVKELREHVILSEEPPR